MTKISDGDENEKAFPRGFLEGVGNLNAPLDTPAIMRDCLYEEYAAAPDRDNPFSAARRLADDLKRRAFSQDKALEILLSFFSEAFGYLNNATISQIEKAVAWVFDKQDHGLTCNGALYREGICFLSQRRCRFHDLEAEILTARRSAPFTVTFPPAARQELKAYHPSEAIYGEYIYEELCRLEHERGLPAGNPRKPILVGFRVLSARVISRYHARGLNKDVATRIIHVLEEVRLIKTVIKGKPSARQRQSNGYIRLLPYIPPSLHGNARYCIDCIKPLNELKFCDYCGLCVEPYILDQDEDMKIWVKNIEIAKAAVRGDKS